MRFTAQSVRTHRIGSLSQLMVGAIVMLSVAAASRPTETSISSRASHTVTGDSCDSVFVWSRVGWTEQEYQATLRHWDSDIPFPSAYLMLALNELGAHLKFDGPLDLSALGTNNGIRGAFDDAPDQRLSTFDTQGMYAFTYEAAGRLSKARVLVSSLSARLDSAVLRALRALNDGGSLLPLPETMRTKAVELRLTIGGSPFADPLAVKAPLFRVRQPVFHSVTPPVSDRKLTIVPRYPDEERKAGMDGEVIIQFIVRADGSVDPTSILIAKATTTSFARNVYDAVLRSKYTAGRIGACPVPFVVAQPLNFRIVR